MCEYGFSREENEEGHSPEERPEKSVLDTRCWGHTKDQATSEDSPEGDSSPLLSDAKQTCDYDSLPQGEVEVGGLRPGDGSAG